MMSKPLLFAALAAFAGCVGEGDVRYGGSVAVTSPDLVTIDNGIQVIADADQPVFYTDNDYWLYRDGGWYKSPDYRSGWGRVSIETVPERLRRIERPEAYVHYRRSNERARTVTRENPPRRDTEIRTPDREPQRYPQPAPAPYPNPLPPQQQPPVPNQQVAPPVRPTPDAVRDGDRDREDRARLERERADRERVDRDKAARDAQERAKKQADERDKDRANRTRDRDDDDKRKRDRDDDDRDDHPDRAH